SSYYEAPEAADRWTDDGWFRTGDIVTIGPDGDVEVQDRAKDLLKSGSQGISTVALENALMGHPAIAEAAVIAVPDEKWAERPLGVVGLRDDGSGPRARHARAITSARPPATPCGTFSRSTSRSSGFPTASSSWTRSRRRPSASSARPRSLSVSPPC